MKDSLYIEQSHDLSFEQEESDPKTDLYVEQTELALERTNLAWITTVIVMISAGFAIDKLAEMFYRQNNTTSEAWVKQAHIVGLSLTIAGTLMMIVESIYYLGRARELSHMRHKPAMIPIGLILSFIVVFIGMVLVYLVIVSNPWTESTFSKGQLTS